MIANKLFRIFPMLAIAWVGSPVNALDEVSIEKLLKQPILTPNTPLVEVQAFTEKRVPRMPKVKSLEEWEKHASRLRKAVLDNVVFRGEAAKWREAKTKVEWLDTIDGGPGYRIKKLRYEALPGMWIPALLYEPMKLDGKRPVVMNVNGHDRANGKAAKYKQIRCINQAKRGMIALNVEWLGMGQLNVPGNGHYRMNQLDLCGTSGLAPFYLAMSRGIDVLLSHEHADPDRVAVAGLSGGGWQTIVISALDTRVTLANPVAGYSSFRTRVHHQKDLGDSEQTPNDLAAFADYTHLTAMLAPRAALLTYNIKDNCCFESGYALPPLLEAAEPIYKLYGKAHLLRSHVNRDPGTHNFEQDNREALYRMFRDVFYPNDKKFNTKEITSDKELKTKEELHVPLPKNNATFHSLALSLSKALPRDADLPTESRELTSWQSRAASKLRKTVVASTYHADVKVMANGDHDRVRVRHLQLRLSDEWTIPVVEFTPKDPGATVVVVDQRGRAAAAKAVHHQLESGNRVLAVDPFYFGESRIAKRDFLYALLVASVGERPLGIQASQLAALARWNNRENKQPITLVGYGPRSSTFCLVAAALENKAIAAVELHDSFGSLKEVIENDQGVNQTPEMFCFGLLEHLDVLQMAALVAPRRVTFHDPSKRQLAELKPLAAVLPGMKGLGLQAGKERLFAAVSVSDGRVALIRSNCDLIAGGSCGDPRIKIYIAGERGGLDRAFHLGGSLSG
ncbi:MAG: acetylxylan esterase, partial [Planctomycetes bacterium]|nr:acetylxylan esterase [Planctomycetota bacterium]